MTGWEWAAIGMTVIAFCALVLVCACVLAGMSRDDEDYR